MIKKKKKINKRKSTSNIITILIIVIIMMIISYCCYQIFSYFPSFNNNNNNKTNGNNDGNNDDVVQVIINKEQEVTQQQNIIKKQQQGLFIYQQQQQQEEGEGDQPITSDGNKRSLPSHTFHWLWTRLKSYFDIRPVRNVLIHAGLYHPPIPSSRTRSGDNVPMKRLYQIENNNHLSDKQKRIIERNEENRIAKLLNNR